MPRLKQSPPSRSAVEALLGATAFRLGPRTSRVLTNLRAHGGEVAAPGDRGVPWIGDDLPPLGAPAITLGEGRGTLGPHSFGFLDNRRGVAAYAGSLPRRPRCGPIALVCGRRELLPEVGPLALARDLGLSWIISVGDGDVAPVLAFLAQDPGTAGIMLAAAAPPTAPHLAGGKPLLLLEGDPLLRAAVRARGGQVTDELEPWLAHGALLEACPEPPRRVAALVVGGGASILAQAAHRVGLTLPIQTLDDSDPRELVETVDRLGEQADLLLLCGLDPAELPLAQRRGRLFVDLGHGEQVRALCRALADRAPSAEPALARPSGDPGRGQAILDEAGGEPGDHDGKRILRLYGATVSRQAPATSATAAGRIALQVGFPCEVLPGDAQPGAPEARLAANPTEARRFAALLLERAPFVLVRESFPSHPRARLTVERSREVGVLARVGEVRALLPLATADARLLSAAAGAQDEAAFALLLVAITTVAEELGLRLEVELYVGDRPAVIAVAARRQR